MSTRAINVILLLLLATAGVLAWSIRKDPGKPNIEILPDMTRSIPYDSFAPNRVFPDGKTLRQPPAHTVPRGALRARFAATEEDAVRAGQELTSPFSAEDQDALRRGGRVYQSFCLPCHGPRGAADGMVVKKGYPAPPALSSPGTVALADGTIFHIITHGKGNMPPHASQIAQEDRWKAVLHIRSLQAAR